MLKMMEGAHFYTSLWSFVGSMYSLKLFPLHNNYVSVLMHL